MTQRLGVAVIGAGTISDQYLESMTSYPDLDVVFVADVVPERARAQAEKFRVAGAGSTADALVRDDVELVVNLTIPAVHAEVAHEALAAGKHVWNEKPLATTLEDATTLVDEADRRGLRLGAAPDTVLGPGIQTAWRMMEDGAIGRPLTASVVMQSSGPHRWHPNPDFLYAAGAGPLLDLGPYYLTTLVQLLGGVRRVVALGASAGPTRVIGAGPRAGQTFDVGVPTYVTALYEFDGAVVAQATFSFDSALERTGVVEIAGSDGTLVAPDPNMFGGVVDVVRPGPEQLSTVRTRTLVREGKAGRGIGVLDMARAIRAGRPHRATGRTALHVLDVLLATQHSIETGGFCTVTSKPEPPEPLPHDWDPTEATIAS